MNATVLLNRLRGRGFALSAVGGSLRISPASALTPDDRAEIRANVAGLLAALTPAGPWNLAEAIRLMDGADALVERLRAPGSHPAIQAAAVRAVAAHHRHDMPTLRAAVAEVERHARRLSRTGNPHS